MEPDITIKIIVIGDSGVGKSSIIQSYIEKKTDPYMCTTIGVDFFIKNLEVDDLKSKVVIWDTAGQEKYRAINKSYYRGSHAIFIVFDLGSHNSFNNLSYWIEQIDSQSNKSVKILVGNKIDDKSIITEDQIDDFLESHPDFMYFTTSATKNQNIDLLFDRCIRDCINLGFYQSLKPTNQFELHQEDKLDKCCES